MAKHSVTAARRRRDRLREIGAVAWIVLALVLGGLYAWQVWEERQQAACQSDWNATFAAQLSARSKVTTAADEAQSNLLAGVSKLVAAIPSEDPKVNAKRAEEFRTLFRKFDRATLAVEKARRDNPLPALPDC